MPPRVPGLEPARRGRSRQWSRAREPVGQGVREADPRVLRDRRGISGSSEQGLVPLRLCPWPSAFAAIPRPRRAEQQHPAQPRARAACFRAGTARRGLARR